MNNIAIIADKNIAKAFNMFGIEVFSPKSAIDAGAILKKLTDQSRPIIFITQYWAADLMQDINLLRSEAQGAIVVIPDTRPSTGLGEAIIKTACEKAVGISEITTG